MFIFRNPYRFVGKKESLQIAAVSKLSEILRFRFRGMRPECKIIRKLNIFKAKKTIHL